MRTRSVATVLLIVAWASSRQVWRGTEKNDEDTSGFGSLVLTDVPAR
jgi:hypothetical protein